MGCLCMDLLLDSMKRFPPFYLFPPHPLPLSLPFLPFSPNLLPSPVPCQQQQQQQPAVKTPQEKQAILEKFLTYLDKATPEQQEQLLSKIRATPEQRQQLLARVQAMRMQRQQQQQSLMQQQQAQGTMQQVCH